MNLSIKIFLTIPSFLTLFSLSCTAVAQDHDVNLTSEKAFESEPKTPSASKFAVGLRTVNFQYEEPGWMKDSGILTGVGASYFHQIKNGILFRADGEYVSGQTNYEGGLQKTDGSVTPWEAKNKYRVMSLSGMGIFSTRLTESFVTASMFGLGYRNTLDGKDERYDYRRDITYYYLIMGLQFEAINDGQNIFLIRTELDTLLGGQAKTDLSDVDSDLPDLDLEFRSGYSAKIALEYFYTLQNERKLFAELSYQRWQLSQSKPSAGFVEPANKTALTNLTLGCLF